VSSPVVQLPEAQLRPLLAAYDASVRTRRGHTLLVLACIVVAMMLASVSAEVSPARLIDNIGRFPSYIIRLFQLENGQPAWTDFTEWFWGLPRWLRLLGETLLMAYVGTLLGAAAGAFGLLPGRRQCRAGRWLRFAVWRSASFAVPCRCWSSPSCS
jgi:phosphonate transport system permease protein